MLTKLLATITGCLIILLLGVTIGSVYVPPGDVFNIIGHATLGRELASHITPANYAIVWNLRLPRVLIALLAGAALSVSGALMQSVLRNPLASSYTLGVSSGASLGAALVIFLGVSLPVLPVLTLPVLGFVFGFATILLAMAFASRLDGQMENVTIILVGMVFSLFINAFTTLLSAISREHIQRLVFWQMGSFSMLDWRPVLILAPVTVIGIIYIYYFRWELNVMTFGEEQARSMGVDSRKIKWALLLASAVLTGGTIAFVGVVGFVDLVAPHVVRKIFGSAHNVVIPMSAVMGGAFMVLCDLAARTVIAPVELPVGAVTALIGAPFFAYVYFSQRR